MVSCSLCHAFFANSSLILCCLIINLLLFFSNQGGPLFVVVYLPSWSLFWVRSLRSIWESNTSRFHLGCWISKWVTGVWLWNGVPSPGSWSLGHMPFVVLISFLVLCHTHVPTLICADDCAIIVQEFCMHGNKDILIWLDLTFLYLPVSILPVYGSWCGDMLDSCSFLVIHGENNFLVYTYA